MFSRIESFTLWSFDSGANLNNAKLDKTHLSAPTDMSGALFVPFVPRSRKTSRRSALPGAASEVGRSAMQNLLGYLCCFGQEEEERGSDDNSNASDASDEEEMEDDEDDESWGSEVKPKLSSLIAALACAAGVIDRHERCDGNCEKAWFGSMPTAP